MSIRAKFKVDAIDRRVYTRYEQQPDGTHAPKQVEMQSIALSPVHATDANPENKKFWGATPQGKIDLGVINPEAWSHFELGREYYVDFTLDPASQGPPQPDRPA